MGYFNINSILYNFRKIFKYLSISLAFISFIVVCLLLMTRDVEASSTPTPTPSIVLPSFPSEAYNYNSRVVWPRSNGSFRLVCCNSSPVYSSALNELRFESPGISYTYIPGTNSDWVFDYDFSPSITYNYTFNIIYSSMNIYFTGTSDIFYPASSSEPTEPSYREPFIALPNDTTQAYISGEFSQFLVIGTSGIEDLQFFLTANPDVLPTTNSLALNLDDDSPYYLNNFEPEDGSKYFAISKYDLPQGYTNDTLFHSWLAYRYNNQVYLTDVIEWTTDFTAKAIENDNIRLESGMADSLSNINGLLKDKTYNSNTLISGLPNSDEYIAPTDSGFSTLFNSLYTAFTTSNSVPVRFYIPFTNDYIEIPADLISSHLPNTIVFLIQAFYWYLICRFIVKDIARIAQKIKSGEFLEESTGNIKTDLL